MISTNPQINADFIFYLLDQNNKINEKMQGNIRTKQKCPTCQGAFTHFDKLGLICTQHRTIPTRYFVDIHYNGERVKLYSDKSGRVLDSYGIAAETLEHIRYEIRNHQFDPSKYVKADLNQYLFEKVIDKWINEKKEEADKGQLSHSYILPLKGMVKNYFLPFFNHRDIREIRTIDIKEFYRQLPHKLKPKTHRNIIHALENLFNTLIADELIDKKPIFPTVSVPDAETKWCRREVQDNILNAIPEKHRAIFFFLTRQGVRPGEVVALKWEDIDFAHGILIVKRTMSNRTIMERTKTKKIRPRLLHSDIMEILCSIPRGLPHIYLFINPNTGRPYMTDTLQRLWKIACQKVGEEISLYQATRHSVASMAASSGVSIHIIKEVMGHTDIRTTLRYAHVDVQSQAQVFEAQKHHL